MIGERIKSRRLALGLSQKELASAAGIAQQTIHSLESGRSNSSRALVKLAAALETSPAWLDGSEIIANHQTIEVNESASAYHQAITTIPIVGNNQHGYDENWWAQGCPQTWHGPYLDVISQDSTAHAFRITTDDYSPRLLAGEVISLSRQQDAVSGEDILIIQQSGHCLIRQLVQFQRHELIALKIGSSSHREIFMLDDVKQVFPITGIYPSSRIIRAK